MAVSLAVVLLNYKRPQNMGVIVNSVREALPDAPVFILDQAESNDFQNRSDIPWSEVWLKRSRINMGAGARVLLASKLPFDLFVSIDDDTFLESDQIKRLAELLRAEPDRAHGVWGERLERSEGQFRFRSGICRVDKQVSILNQAYAFSREQAVAAMELSGRIGYASWQDVVVGNDIVLSCASPKTALCHDLGPLRICPTTDAAGIAVSQREGFRERRAEIARRLVVARAIGVFAPPPGPSGRGLSEPIFDLGNVSQPVDPHTPGPESTSASIR
jgi:hypothetical protein